MVELDEIGIEAGKLGHVRAHLRNSRETLLYVKRYWQEAEGALRPLRLAMESLDNELEKSLSSLGIVPKRNG